MEQVQKTPDEAAADVLADIKRAEREILDLYMQHCQGPIGYQHLFLFGIARRALAQSVAFRQMIEKRNSLVGSSLIRMQLDTVLRLYALFWVRAPESFAEKVFKGTDINRLKAKDGQLLTDGYLKKRVSSTNPWIVDVYRETSGYIHFSNRHMKAALRRPENEDGPRVQLVIGPQDIGKPLSYYGEMLRAFCHLTMIIPVAAGDWFSRMKKSGAKFDVGIFPNAPSIRTPEED